MEKQNDKEMTNVERMTYLQDLLAKMEGLMNEFFTETDKWLKEEKENMEAEDQLVKQMEIFGNALDATHDMLVAAEDDNQATFDAAQETFNKYYEDFYHGSNEADNNEERYIKIQDLIKEAKSAAEAGFYFAALTLTFTLVAECSVIEYPNEDSDKKRFKKWCNTYVETISKNQNGNQEIKLPKLDGELLYQIRCCLFHEGSTDIDFADGKKISYEENSKLHNTFDSFVFVISKILGMSVTLEASEVLEPDMWNHLIAPLLYAVKDYVNNNPEKQFNEIPVIDYRELK